MGWLKLRYSLFLFGVLIVLLLTSTAGDVYANSGSGLKSNQNAEIYETSCVPLTDPSSYLSFNSTMLTTDGAITWSAQMNAYPYQTGIQPNLDFMQFDMAVNSSMIYGSAEFWNATAGTLMNHSVELIPRGTLSVSAGDSFLIQLYTNNTGVYAASYTYYNLESGQYYTGDLYFQKPFVVPVVAWQLNVAKENNGGFIDFTSGGGSITYDSSSGTLLWTTTQGTCSFAGAIFTGEFSNMMVSTPTSNVGAVFQGFEKGDVTVITLNQEGIEIDGYYTVLYQGTTVLGTGFSTVSFGPLTVGDTYSVKPDDYANCVFNHWQDTGNTTRQRSFVASSTPPVFYAVYDCTGTLTVSTVNGSDEPITGYYTTLWQGLTGSTLVNSCFSPCTFTLNASSTYRVEVANYGSESFSYWSDGYTTHIRPVIVDSTGNSTSQ